MNCLGYMHCIYYVIICFFFGRIHVYIRKTIVSSYSQLVSYLDVQYGWSRGEQYLQLEPM